MHLNAGAVQRRGFEPDARSLDALQLRKKPGRARQPWTSGSCGCRRCASCQVQGQLAPLAAMLEHVKHGVESLQIGQSDVAALHWQAVGYFFILNLAELHCRIFSPVQASCPVLTSPSRAQQRAFRKNAGARPALRLAPRAGGSGPRLPARGVHTGCGRRPPCPGWCPDG